ncbi:hypothetical protein ACKI2N_032365 [Cupriavidus sp. 30B13]|uniref:hypothetical protein n=1 Tax=Cupriavidus sp. 30B13 TaxID=3384241 RepID=UPI003B91D0AE
MAMISRPAPKRGGGSHCGEADCARPAWRNAPPRATDEWAALRREVKALVRQAASAATHLDAWLRRQRGRRQILAFAAACELGLGTQSQIPPCLETMRGIDSPALRALFWAAVNRIRVREANTGMGEAGSMDAEAADRLLNNRAGAACPSCIAFSRLGRQAAPAAHLLARGQRIRDVGQQRSVQSRYVCGHCGTQWIQQHHPWEFFSHWYRA